MSYSKKVQKAKANRSDHRKARAVAGSVNRTSVKRDSKKFKSLEREHDQDQRFGGNLKAVYFDSDGDGYKDTYGRVYRSGVVGKPGAEIPTFGPIVPPVSGPTNLLAAEILSAPAPASGPSSLIASIVAPANGPTGLGASISIPIAGPTGLGASVNSPIAGPTGLGAELLAPANGPTGLNAFEGIPDAPVSGPTTLAASVNAPANGPTSLGASVIAPANGPTGLGASEVVDPPASGPTGLGASVNAPAEGPTELGASEVFPAPASGPTGLSAAKATLNINIEASQDTIVAKTTEPAGTIEYASDVGYLFIYDGTDWHRTDGGNS